jgi:hypothetical protein
MRMAHAKERKMAHPYGRETIPLAARSIHRLENGLHARVACLSGNVWITQENDQRDILLTPGQSAVLDRPGLALVMALSDACLSIETPAAMTERLAA